MNILHVVEATTAGVGRHVFDLCRHMQSEGHRVRVACPAVRQDALRDIQFAVRLENAHIPIDRIPMRRSINPLADLVAFVRLRHLFRQIKPDVIHAHSSKAGALARLAAWRLRPFKPVIVYTPNAFAFQGNWHPMARRFILAMERCLGHHATDRIICVGPSELSLARRKSIAPGKKLVLVENAIDVSDVRTLSDSTAARMKLGFDIDRPLVGCIGRLAPQKGLNVLVQAAGLVVKAGVNAQFAIFGEGPSKANLAALVAEKELSGVVELKGYQSDIPSVLAALDLFVLPSLYEGLPYSLLEAMAAGRPVIATDIGGNRDLVVHGESGWLVPAQDPLSLAKALIYLLEHPAERCLLGQRALIVANSRPGTNEMARRVIALYQLLLDERQMGSS